MKKTIFTSVLVAVSVFLGSLNASAQTTEKDVTIIALTQTPSEFTTKNLNLLLQDLRLNPKRYAHFSLFGKKQKEFTLPDEDPALIVPQIKN